MAGGCEQPQLRARARARARGCFGRGQALENTWKGLEAPRCGAALAQRVGTWRLLSGLAAAGQRLQAPRRIPPRPFFLGSCCWAAGHAAVSCWGCWLGAPQEESPPRSTGCALAAGPSSLHQDAKARQSRSEEDGAMHTDLEPVPRPPDTQNVQRLPASRPAHGAGSTYLHRRARPFPKQP